MILSERGEKEGWRDRVRVRLPNLEKLGDVNFVVRLTIITMQVR